MKLTKNKNHNPSKQSILFGVLTVAAVVVLGVTLAFATGTATPVPTHAQYDDAGSMGGDAGDISGGLSDISVDTGSLDVGSLDTGSVDTGDTGISAPTEDTGTAPCDCGGLPTVDTTPSTDSTPPTYVDVPPTEDTGTTPCDCGGDAVPPPDTTPNPPTEDTGTIPCDCGGTPETPQPPTEIPPIVVTPPVVVPPVIIPPVVPPVTPPYCPYGDTGTYPNCIPPSPPPVCPTGDTGTYPNCVPPPNPPPVCPAGDTGTYPNCTPPVPPPGGCVSNCGGGGGGGTPPVIYGGGSFGGGVSGQIIRQAPVASMVYLSQIPYTGLDLGPVGTVVYWVLLVLICASAAYLIIFNLLPWLYRMITSFGHEVGHALNQPAGLAMAGAAGAHGASGHGTSDHGASSHDSAGYNPHANEPASPYSEHAPSHVLNSATMTRENPSAYSAVKGFASFAQGNTLTIDDIVNGLARLPEVQEHQVHVEQQYTVTTAPAPEHHSVQGLSHEQPAPQEFHAAPQAVQPMQQKMEQPSRKEITAAQVSTDVRDFCAALLNGNRDVVFGTLRQVVREGGDAEAFITQVVCALDDAYRNRVDGTPVNGEIARLTQNCATSFLERLTTALTNAVDSSYSPGISGSKLALTRALAVVEG